MPLKDKFAVISGAATENGIGYATARLFAEEGATVALLDLERNLPEKKAAILGENRRGHRARGTSQKGDCKLTIMSTIPDSQVVAVSDRKVDGAIRKAKNRLVPMIIIMYLIAYIDRANIGFAALRMNADLNLTPDLFGFAAGLLFWLARPLREEWQSVTRSAISAAFLGPGSSAMSNRRWMLLRPSICVH